MRRLEVVSSEEMEENNEVVKSEGGGKLQRYIGGALRKVEYL